MGKASKTNGKESKIGASAKDLGFKYGVTDLAEKLGIADASARVQLRNKGIEKNGAVYGWNSRAELDEVIALIKEGGKSEKKAKPEKKAKEEKPSKEKKAKKAGRAKASKDDGGEEAGEGAEA